jgi:large subunit ribosomal protein L25
MADIELTGEVREQFGKGAARRMRVAGKIPATIYAGGNQPVYIELPMKETTLAVRRRNALFEISYGKKKQLAIIKDIQHNPVKQIIEHIDFYEVVAGEKIVVEVPVFVEGEPKGSAVAFIDIQQLPVRADVTNLPERITISVDGLQDGDKVFAKDVTLPQGAELALDDAEVSVVTVEVPAEQAEEAAPAAEAPAAE